MPKSDSLIGSPPAVKIAVNKPPGTIRIAYVGSSTTVDPYYLPPLIALEQVYDDSKNYAELVKILASKVNGHLEAHMRAESLGKNVEPRSSTDVRGPLD